ncbi:MAG: hypothetical protein SRB2_03589 [Desulfobacteraceae bacterium Eth-SRB2]|nr:MAG: hypothetical protein SRB2_03589 [Desulfobacteraceae bacterium Eth-SRB2]
MNILSQIDIEHIQFLSRHRLYDHLKNCLRDPHFSVLKSIVRDRSSLCLEKIRCHLSEKVEILRLFQLHLMTEVFLYGGRLSQSTRHWITDQIDTKLFFPETNIDLMASGRWAVVPAILMKNQCQGTVRYFIAGAVPDFNPKRLWPEWADPLMDKSFKASIIAAKSASEKASQASEDLSLFCYPLTIQTRALQFSGKSMGLSMFLGFKKVFCIEDSTNRLLATGGIDPHGNILKVTGIFHKVQIAKSKGFRVVLYPSSNRAFSEFSGMTLLQVSNLEQAQMFSALYAPNTDNRLILFSEMLNNSDRFIENLHAVPHTWISWAVDNKKTEKIADFVVSNPRLFKKLVHRFEEGLLSGDVEHSRALSNVFPKEKILKEVQSAPLTSFKWFTLNLALSNHRGDVSAAVKWAQHASGLAEQALKADMESVADFYNHRFILLHNRFEFNPDLSGGLKHLINSLENVYEKHCEIGSPTFPALGRLYGSLVQNYGFCGPDYLEFTEDYTRKARKALGEQSIPEYKDEWLRPFNYLTYAYLDADRFDKATNSLFNYLEITTFTDLWLMLPEFSPWQHAILARFLADTGNGENAQKYFHWGIKNINDIKKGEHPWQLWCFNMGRIAIGLDDPENAFQLFSRSLDICLSQSSGPTIQVMALLPLSGLLSLDALKYETANIAKKIIETAARELNSEYFSILEKKDFETVLKIVLEKPERLFPFTYH